MKTTIETKKEVPTYKFRLFRHKIDGYYVLFLATKHGLLTNDSTGIVIANALGERYPLSYHDKDWDFSFLEEVHDKVTITLELP